MNTPTGKTRRVLQIIGESKFGGATRMILALLNMARSHGWETAVLSDDPTTVQACHERNIDVVEFHGIIRPIRPWTDFRAARRLARLLHRRGDTIVHTHTLKGGLIGRWAAHAAGVPIIIHHSHGMSFQDESPRLRKTLIARAERFATARCDHVISVNRPDIDWAVQNGVGPESRFTHIPNGLDRQEIDAVRAMDRTVLCDLVGIPPTSAILTVVGRLVVEKGHPWLFQALPAITGPLGRPVHLILLGDGPDRAAFAMQVNALNLTSKVHFIGYRSDCLSIAKASDLFVLPSLREGHSITILEAMALGVPIVATDIRGIRDSVRHEREALLVPARNSHSLAQTICRMFGDPALAGRLQHAARQRYLEEFTEERMLHRVWDVYRRVASSKGLAYLFD